MKQKLLVLLMIVSQVSGFDLALPGYRYAFPRDHFKHSNFRSEWWYYTGNLETSNGRHFGFELTFFRLGVDRDRSVSSPWELDDVYLAHLALSDMEGQEFYRTERMNRAGPGLAGADLKQSRIWNGNWEVRWLVPSNPLGSQRLRAFHEEFSFEFELSPRKPPVIHGKDGVSPKGEGPGKASHYISFTRLEVFGAVELQGQSYEVTGTAWMDHEFSTDSLSPDQVGWDWVSIQLENDTELMLYRMRRSDGSTSYLSGTFVDAAGTARSLNRQDILMEPGDDFWESPDTGGKYPMGWSVAVPRLGIELALRTGLRSQEVVSERELSPNYWEGAVTLEGVMAGKPVRAVGYLEMTGYDKPLSLSERDETSTHGQ